MKYQTFVRIPDVMQAFVQELNGVGEVLQISDQHLIVELESDDLYELGVTIRDLESTLSAITCEPIHIERPKEAP